MKTKIIKAIKLLSFWLYSRVGGLFIKLDKNKILFLSESHRILDGNLKAIYDALPDSYEKVTHLKGDRRNEGGIKELFSIWKDMTSSAYIFLDDFYGLTSTQKVRPGQEIIQLWHGCGAFKKFGYSRLGTGDNPKRIHSGYKKYTKAITSSEFIRPCYAEAFGIDIEKAVATGVPRTDVFFNKEELEKRRSEFFKSYPELQGKKLVLFAPTYRGKRVEDADYDFKLADLDRLKQELGEDYEILTRWHPALRNNVERGEKTPYNTKTTKDFSSYGDVNDLLIVADVLITDYSSIIFEYSLLNKPIIYFAYDLDEYDAGRGLYFDFDRYVFGTVVKDREDLAKAIKDENLAEEKRSKFNEEFMSACDGKASLRIIKEIIGDRNDN